MISISNNPLPEYELWPGLSMLKVLISSAAYGGGGVSIGVHTKKYNNLTINL